MAMNAVRRPCALSCFAMCGPWSKNAGLLSSSTALDWFQKRPYSWMACEKRENGNMVDQRSRVHGVWSSEDTVSVAHTQTRL